MSTGRELLLAAVVAGTFGFGGLPTPFPIAALLLSLVCLAGFVYSVMNRINDIRKGRQAKQETIQEPSRPIGLWL